MAATGKQSDHREAVRMTFGGIAVEFYPSDGAAIVFVEAPTYNVTLQAGRVGSGNTASLHHRIIVSPWLPQSPPIEKPTDAPPTTDIPPQPPTIMGLEQPPDVMPDGILSDTDLPPDEWAQRSAANRQTGNIRLEIGREKLDRLIEQAQGGAVDLRGSEG